MERTHGKKKKDKVREREWFISQMVYWLIVLEFFLASVKCFGNISKFYQE